MFSVEATIESDKHVPFSVTETGVGRGSLKAQAHHVGSVCEVAAGELNLNGSQLVVGSACSLPVAGLLLWAILKLWLFEPSV